MSYSHDYMDKKGENQVEKNMELPNVAFFGPNLQQSYIGLKCLVPTVGTAKGLGFKQSLGM